MGQVDTQDVRRWVGWLLRHYTESYANQRYRSLQQFLRWLAVEDKIVDPMARLRVPKVTGKPVPFFGSVELFETERGLPGQRVRAAARRRRPRAADPRRDLPDDQAAWSPTVPAPAA